MTKPGDKDWLPREEYLRSIPKKRVSAGVLFLNATGELLLVKPAYKDVWVIPGGSVDQYESPRDGAIREVHEEIGLDLIDPEFIGVVHAPRPEEEDDVMHFFFYGGVLSDEVKLSLQADELDTYRFVSVADAPKFMVPQFAARLDALLEAIRNNKPVFFQDERMEQNKASK